MIGIRSKFKKIVKKELKPEFFMRGKNFYKVKKLIRIKKSLCDIREGAL